MMRCRASHGKCPQVASRRCRDAALALEHGAVVELDDADGARWGGLHAQLAKHALVEVLVDDGGGAIGCLGEDVYGADFGQLLRQIAVGCGVRSEGDADEHRGHQTLTSKCSRGTRQALRPCRAGSRPAEGGPPVGGRTAWRSGTTQALARESRCK